MKKIIFCSILAITFTHFLIAQGSIPFEKKPLPPLPGKPAEITGWITDLTVFEFPKQRGRQGNFRTGPDGSLIPPPFPVSNVSITVAKGKIVYIKNCSSEFATEAAYTTSQAYINLTGICGIRSDDKSAINIEFNGFSTIIHNNDCKRFFGNVKIKIVETSPDGSAAISYMPLSSREYRADAFTFIAYNNANANTAPREFTRRTYVFNASPVPELRENFTLGRFDVGANAVREGRVSIAVTSDLGSAHKTCDLCDDFSSNVRMTAPVTDNIFVNRTVAGGRVVNAANNRVVLGPYQAHGSRDGSAITAHGGSHLEFRVHLTVSGL